jgi:hypothetical protein
MRLPRERGRTEVTAVDQQRPHAGTLSVLSDGASSEDVDDSAARVPGREA